MYLNLQKYLIIGFISFLLICYIALNQNEVIFGAYSNKNSIITNTTYFTNIVENISETLANENYRISSTPSGNETSENPMYNISDVMKNNFVDLAKIKPSASNIFFVESKCGTDNLSRVMNVTHNFTLSPRQCCAVESTARNNPERNVFIVHTCPLREDFCVGAPKYAQSLLRLPNVRVVRYNSSEVFRDTPVQGLWERGALETSNYPVEHASDVLRLTLLWRFGGTYCDTDVVSIRPLDTLGSNFCGFESDAVIGNAVLNFEPSGKGHDLLSTALNHINDHFDGTRWTVNGNDVITRLIFQYCNNTLTNCTFNVYDHTVFYPIYWWDWEPLFDSARGPQIVEDVKKTAVIVHIWNKLAHALSVNVGSTQAYGLLAEEFCPSVYRNCGDIF